MSSLKVAIFDNVCEVLSFKSDDSPVFSIECDKTLNGYLGIGDLTCELTDGRACLNIRPLSDGKYLPKIVTKCFELALPGLTKRYNTITLAECDSDFVRELSLRERKLEAEVTEIKEKLLALSESVYGAKIF